jgi:small subunit ribosomal protein S20
MANTSSAKKAIRVSERKKLINLKHKKAFREAKKAVKKAILANEPKDKIQALVSKAYKEIDKASKTNILHKNAASRQKSRLVAQVKKSQAK